MMRSTSTNDCAGTLLLCVVRVPRKLNSLFDSRRRRRYVCSMGHSLGGDIFPLLTGSGILLAVLCCFVHASCLCVLLLLHAVFQKCPGLDQYSIAKFGEAFEAIPRALCENAGMNATDILSSLYAAHKAGRTDAGVDVLVCNTAVSPPWWWVFFSVCLSFS